MTESPAYTMKQREQARDRVLAFYMAIPGLRVRQCFVYAIDHPRPLNQARRRKRQA